jgi:O-antigen ligase|tara:strand:+ start:1051 stop:1185 length:135 start_codon:yes stop_codon:yes gene_type:complete
MGGIESGIAGFFSIIFIFYVLYLLIDAEGKRIRKEKKKKRFRNV